LGSVWRVRCGGGEVWMGGEVGVEVGVVEVGVGLWVEG